MEKSTDKYTTLRSELEYSFYTLESKIKEFDSKVESGKITPVEIGSFSAYFSTYFESLKKETIDVLDTLEEKLPKE